MTILELRAELLKSNTSESVFIADALAELPPYFTTASLQRMNAAYARGIRLMCVMPDINRKHFETVL